MVVVVVVVVVAAVVVVAVVAAAVVFSQDTGVELPERRWGALQPLSPPVRPRTTQLRDRNFIAICNTEKWMGNE